VSEADMPEHYRLDERERDLLTAAATLMKKVANAEILRPAELVSVAKLQHVFSLLPRVTHDLEVTVAVTGPRRNFGEAETWHYWEVGIEGKQLSISSGGHFYQPSTGGDSFTTMEWTAVSEKPAELADYRGTLWMVPDIQSFPEAVADIDFAQGAYRIEITDSDNGLLEDDEDPDHGAYEIEEPSSKGLSRDENNEESTADARTREPWLVTPLDAAEKRLAAKVDPAEVDANEPQQAYNAENCAFCGCLLIERGLFVDGRLRGELTWGNMCANCFECKGDGVGWGRGQIYARQPDGAWRMVAGFQSE
jgi:hypothetical protein